jgi:hypothetical protein
MFRRISREITKSRYTQHNGHALENILFWFFNIFCLKYYVHPQCHEAAEHKKEVRKRGI